MTLLKQTQDGNGDTDIIITIYLNYQDDDLEANEQLDQENEEQNNDENIHDDELHKDENGIHYEDDDNDQNNDEEDLEESEDDVAEDRCDFYHGM